VDDLRKEHLMNRSRKAGLVALALILVGGSITSAMAETQWDRNHPRRYEVNERLANQSHRINREYREGELTGAQAVRLHREDRAIRNEERAMARFDNGHITRAEQRALNQQENAVSKQIGR
jgi:hypothetical protein